MRERAIELVAARPPATDGRNLLREYVQSRMLSAMQDAGAMVPLAFMGGTALRFLFRTPRFSEDLDFTLEGEREPFAFRELAARIERQLIREGYDLRVRVSDAGVVAKASFGFRGLPAAAGLTPHVDESLKVKLEVDLDPPQGAGLAVSVVDRFGPLRLHHHDVPSLFAGKLAAVLGRPYTKGRDLYDLMWYLMRETPPEPNRALLANALAQTAPAAVAAAAADWRAAVRERLATVSWADARRDVAPFLEQPRDVEFIEAATFERLLAGAGQ